MFNFSRLCVGLLARCFRSRRRLLLENLALRQQLAVLKRRQVLPFDKLFWVLACRLWSDWKKSLLVVTPETVVRWHRNGFRLYWSLISKVRKQVGRKRLSREVRKLIFRMVAENPTWGAPRIHGELLMLGFDVSERTISRWMKRAPRDPRQPSVGGRFLRITGKRLRRWTSSPCPRSRSASSTVSLSSATIAGVSCISTSRSIRRAVGSSSSCGRRFRLRRLQDF